MKTEIEKQIDEIVEKIREDFGDKAVNLAVSFLDVAPEGYELEDFYRDLVVFHATGATPDHYKKLGERPDENAKI